MKRTLLFQMFLWCLCWPVLAQSPSVEIPEAPNPARFVMDYSGILNDTVCASLEKRLGILSDSTSIQIQVVAVKDLKGTDPIEYGTELGRKWGVGGADTNNGVVIVIQPKTAENGRGDVGIAVGYGLEAVLTDAFCKRVIEKEFIPYFNKDDYAGGLCAGLDAIIPVAKGESSADTYLSSSKDVADKEKEEAPSTGTVFLYIFLIIAGGVGFGVAVKSILERRGVNTSSRGINNDPTEEDTKRHYSSSSGSSRGRSYGGGSFGGGGAKGSW